MCEWSWLSVLRDRCLNLIRNLVEARIHDLRKQAVGMAFQQALSGDDAASRVTVADQYALWGELSPSSRPSICRPLCVAMLAGGRTPEAKGIHTMPLGGTIKPMMRVFKTRHFQRWMRKTEHH